jgi:DNA-binding XRE family transcriptional regulator
LKVIMIRVRSVEALPGYNLAVRFSDGTRGVVDFGPMLARRPFKKLQDEELFARAYVEHGAVTWPGDIDVATEALYAMAHELPKPLTHEDARANELEVSLRELRALAGVTQEEVARAMGMDQGQLSRFERRDDRLLSTLRRYVEALGGKLEIAAVVGDKRLTLRGV